MLHYQFQLKSLPHSSQPMNDPYTFYLDLTIVHLKTKNYHLITYVVSVEWFFDILFLSLLFYHNIHSYESSRGLTYHPYLAAMLKITSLIIIEPKTWYLQWEATVGSHQVNNIIKVISQMLCLAYYRIKFFVNRKGGLDL